MNGKEKFQRAFKIGAIRRCALRCEGRNDLLKHKYLGAPQGRCNCGVGKWPKVLDAPDPTLIQWKNLGIGKIERCFRTFAVYVTSGLILFIGFLIIIKMLQFQDEYKQDSFIACGNLEISEVEAYKAYLDGQDESSSILNCYCLQEFKTKTFGVTDITFENGENACKDWFTNYTLSNSLIYGISAFISGLVGGLRVFLREISIYEGKHTINERLASASTKMWSV